MTTPTGRQYIEHFRNMLRQTQPQGQAQSPYTPEAAARMTPEQVSFSGYGASIDLGRLGRPHSAGTSRALAHASGTIPARSATRVPADRALAHGLGTLSPRRAVVVPPALGPESARPVVRSARPLAPRQSSSPSRLAGSRRSEHRTLDQLMRGTYSSDRDLESLMVSSFQGRQRSRRGGETHALPAMSLERQIRPGRGWETSLRDDSELNAQLRGEINTLNGHFSRADTLRRQALRLGASSPEGQEVALAACREYQAFREGRQQIQQQAQSLPEAQRSRVESWAQHSQVQRSERDFTRLIRRFGLAA